MNPYDILGLTPQASPEEAKKAFRRLAQLHHPDKGGSENKFKEIKAAWEKIEAGWRPPARPTFTPPPQPTHSSFTTPPKPQQNSKAWAAQQYAQNVSRFRFPQATRSGLGAAATYSIRIEVPKTRTALYGAFVQFKCDDDTVTYQIPPGHTESYRAMVVLEPEEMIGKFGGRAKTYTVHVDIQMVAP